LLEENAPERIEERLERLLAHPSAQVRARALHVVRVQRIGRFAARVEEMIRDEDPEVQVQALSAHCAVAGSDVCAPLLEYLGSTTPGVRVAAVLCLIEQAPPESEGRLREVLENLLATGDRTIRTAVAQGLGRRVAPSDLQEMLGPLLSDPDLEVRRAALQS